MHQLYFGRSCAPDAAGGAYSAPPDLYLDSRGFTSKGMEGKEGSGEGEGSPHTFFRGCTPMSNAIEFGEIM